MDKIKMFCSKDCPDTCSFSASVKNGDLKIKPDRFLDKRFVCHKLKYFFKREIKENKAKSRLFFRDAELNDVVDSVAQLLKSGKRILYYRGSGSLGYSMYVWDLLLSSFDNVWFVKGSPCDETGIAAHIEDFGVCTNPPVENLKSADTIVVFGKNSLTVSPHLYSYLLLLSKEKRIIHIDPIKTDSSKIAHSFISINPATDGALAYALIDACGFDRLQNSNNALKLTGISSADFELLKDIFKNDRVAIIEGYGIQRYRNGKNSIQWLNRLACLSGNINRTYYSLSSKENFKKPQIKPANSVYISELDRYLKGGFFDAFFIVATNPVMSLPDNHLWEKSLSEKEAVVVDTNLTQTAEYAEYFLKVGGMFASREAQGSYFFKDKMHFRDKLLNLPSDYDVAMMLAKKLNMKIDLSLKDIVVHKIVERKENFKNIHLKQPYSEAGKIRLISISNFEYLNSQTVEKGIDYLFLSREMMDRLSLKEGKTITVKNGSKAARFIAKATDSIKGDFAFVFKGAYRGVNRICDNISTDIKEALAFNDTFVKITKV